MTKTPFAVVRDHGQPMGTRYDSSIVTGIDPVVEPLPAEVLVTGRTADAMPSRLIRGMGTWSGWWVTEKSSPCHSWIPCVTRSPVSTGSSWTKWPVVGLHRESSTLSRTRRAHGTFGVTHRLRGGGYRGTAACSRTARTSAVIALSLCSNSGPVSSWGSAGRPVSTGVWRWPPGRCGASSARIRLER